MMRNADRLISSDNFSPTDTGLIGSRSPHINKVGQAIFGMSAEWSGLSVAIKVYELAKLFK